MAVSIEIFQQAVTSLGAALALPEDDITRDASIQRFEFCIELGWKTAKKVMGTATSAPKQVVREMGQANYTGNVALWLEAIDQRNRSSHTYNEDIARQVYAFAKEFYPELLTLVTALTQESTH